MVAIFVRGIRYVGMLGALSLLIAGCTQHQISEFDSCVGCHTDYVHLKDVYSEDTVAALGGCGGSAPHYEPYDRVYMSGEGYESFKSSSHGTLSCTYCHGGIDGTEEKDVAHSDGFIKHPSTAYEQKCGGCHAEISDNFKSSLHNGTGQKQKVTMRSGLAGPEEFDMLPAHQIEGYNANCATCHGTCGNCHVNRPPIGGGGLANGHDFKRVPDMLNTCVTCHTSRGGHAYLGVAAGTQADVHLTKMGFDCMNCHNGPELHGDGDTTVLHRYAYSALPKCENCHQGNQGPPNDYHVAHIGDFSCQVCHSQDYNNCGSCHVHGDGARVPSYMDYKIAVNPIPDSKPGFDFAVVRRTLGAPDNWEAYGIDDYANFDVFPTYNFTSPHNILKITERTDVGSGNCSSLCHIRIEGDSTYNKDLYLFEEDLLDWELGATAKITVDGKLPASWFN